MGGICPCGRKLPSEDDDDCGELGARAKSTASVERSSPVRASLKRSKCSPLVSLHIYDVGTARPTQIMNKLLYSIGTGAFHVAIEAFNVEYSYGYVAEPEGATGVFECEPSQCEEHTYREQIQLGQTTYDKESVDKVLDELRETWLGSEYDLVRRNCCDFCYEFAIRLGLESAFPPWVRNLSGAGAAVCKGFENIIKSFQLVDDNAARSTILQQTRSVIFQRAKISVTQESIESAKESSSMSFRGSDYVSSLQRALTLSSELNEDIDLGAIELNEAGFETLAEPSKQDTELEVALSDKRHTARHDMTCVTAAEAKGLDDHEVI